ncbi:chaperone protein AfaB [Escherichia coli]|nr:chaperone protein AfaB [Escherichia coli]
MRTCKSIILILGGALTVVSGGDALAADNGKNNVETTSKVFSLHLGATRVIYNPNLTGATLSVINDQNYPILVQSEVLAEDRKSHAPFIVTPPLFRLDGGQSSHLRIIRTSGEFPSDRETLQWVCVKGIPPKEGDKWAEVDKDKKTDNKMSMQVQLSVKNCIKLFFRPSSVKGHSDVAASQIAWQRSGEKLKGTNSTPFYINLSELTIGGWKVKEHLYISPFSSVDYDLPVGASGKVQWRVINDYGGKSNLFVADVK